MLEEKDLLKDIIKLAPHGSQWNVTYSSEDIEKVFDNLAKIDSRSKSLLIEINEAVKPILAKMIDEYNLNDWIVHQTITNEFGIFLFKSFDNMTTSIILSNFPEADKLILKYKETDLLEYHASQ